ncbi:hypothetical protein D0Z08_24885 [Nocardioides immobilis]|uniref:Calx-beta domain-containing protein n=1 Tax=Nocardioides immobilis TaxID=2049295 RepID=A0A417XVQ2_9ACTN|nr:Calx-beta domain-containing protein [Nocardioides immobilis]RHW24351.1 hypothetical protein D0Z08_24885 [Nocardioides immobilis]
MNPDSRRTRRYLLLLLAATAAPLLVAGATPPALAGPAAAAETRVNTHTSFDQSESDIAMDADGDHVIAWTSHVQDGSGTGVYAQRYSAAGIPQGPETLVPTTTVSPQYEPSVAMDADGDYVIAWTSHVQDGSGTGVYAQRYSAAGIPQGPETLVPTTTVDSQHEPSVAMDADGDYVIAWTSLGQDGSGYGVYAQRYDSAGTPQGTETRINTTTFSGQRDPEVALDADGDYVIAWTSSDQDAGGYGIYGIYAQRYSSTGTPQGTETLVNTTTNYGQFEPSIAMGTEGRYVIAWTSTEQDGSSFGVYAQRYSAGGTPQGAETPVNTTTANGQSDPQVAMDAAGNFVIAWTSLHQDGSDFGVYSQRFVATGAPQGQETRVTATTAGSQYLPSAAMDADGDYVVTWSSVEQDSYQDVFARRFRGPETVDLALSQSDNTDPVAVDGRISYRVRVTNLNDDADVTGVEAIDGAIGAASGVYVVSAVPDGATFLSASGAGWTCGAPTTKITCKLATTIAAGDVAPGLLLTYAAPSVAGPAQHQARVYEAQVDPVPANNVEVERTSVMCAIEFAHPGYAKGESSSITATVTRHGTNCGTSSVQYDSAPGTATLGADFTDVAGALTWADADTIKTFTVPVFDDALDENSERFTLSLSNPVGVLLGGNGLVSGSIGDNDDPPRINFTTATTAATEATGLIELTVRLSAVSGRSVTVALGRGGTATSGADYVTETRLTIPPGQRAATFDLEIVDDAATEGSETANLFLTRPDGATIGSVYIHRITISPSD